MEKRPYRSIEELIRMIDEPNRRPAERLFDENKAVFSEARGASHNHQAWRGGYLDHITETMNIALVLYDALDADVLGERRPLPFSRSDALLVLYLHDVEKPWKYELRKGVLEFKPEFDTKEKVHAFAQEKIKEYGFQLTPEHENGLKYVEGERDYSPKERKQGPLAAFCHMCDVWSARGWYDYPKAGVKSTDGSRY